MSGFYSRGQYAGGPITKKLRGPPRPPHMMSGIKHSEDNSSRLVSFKEFILNHCSNDINEQDALKAYSGYKSEFTRKQIDKFFKDHQEEEWFRNKYRPVEIKKLEEAKNASKIRRKELYDKLIEKLNGDSPSLDYQNSEKLSTFLENFSLLLEGATIEELDDPEARKKFAISCIFLPSVHPSIDKATIEEYAATHPGFLRVAMSEVLPGNFNRRAWITFKQLDPESLRKLSWEFSAHKFKGHETRAIVNREMNNRLRYAPFWFCHTTAAKADLRNVDKLLTFFDGEQCPLLEAVKDHLIEETNEEEQILGVNDQSVPDFEFCQDVELLKALDRVILYLRVVHSYDYYACTEYLGEDDMPQRIGIMYARPSLPASFGNRPGEMLKEFIQAQKMRIDSFFDRPTLSETEQEQLGKKNAEEAVETFIFQNTQEKKFGEKYICKITKKKFTSTEFVRKHMLNRCKEELDECRTQVVFFNNYVADPKRPM